MRKWKVLLGTVALSLGLLFAVGSSSISAATWTNGVPASLRKGYWEDLTSVRYNPMLHRRSYELYYKFSNKGFASHLVQSDGYGGTHPKYRKAYGGYVLKEYMAFARTGEIYMYAEPISRNHYWITSSYSLKAFNQIKTFHMHRIQRFYHFPKYHGRIYN
jgi:hypothetical protein